MPDSLATYLHDHVAGSVYALELVENIQQQHAGKPLGQFAANLRAEIKADREVLEKLIARTGSHSDPVKNLTAWMGEKLSRVKLAHDSDTPLGTLEALEFLELGIHGKWALWRALAAVARTDVRLQGVDFEHLTSRAETQHSEVEERRLEAAHVAFQP
jgi:hypothetical protein